ncbi:MAG: flagellar basal body-associated FliL family protein [Desulfovibrio sp.]|jgi:flagellar FliL protein|nr:flagellar basal body-associated FliL family protein [Desulfovibrio sp.]
MPPKTSAKEAPSLPEAQAEPKKKSKAKRIVIILAILLITLSGAGFGGYWWLYLRKPADPHASVSNGEAAPGASQAAAGATGRETGSAASGSAGASGGASAGGGALIEAQKGLPRSAGIVLPLPPVTVNLADPGGRRYLKLGMEVEVNSDVSKDIKAQTPRIRDAVIMLLAGKSYNDIATPDGKVMLKAEVAARLNQILGAQRVIRVYFTDFVVE